MKTFLSIVCGLFGLFWSSAASAQVLIGQCNIAYYGQVYMLYSDGMFIQAGNPMNRAFAARDPSGMTAVMLPSSKPNLRYFVNWNGQIVEIATGFGWRVVGACSITLPPPPPPPFFPPISQTFGVPVPGGLAALPQTLVNPNNIFAPPMVATEAGAQTCLNQNGDAGSRAFKECVLREMAGAREMAVYDCLEESGGNTAQAATCTIGALGGTKEREVAGQVEQCRQEYGEDYSQYPLCLAGKQFDGDIARLIGCLQQQSASGQTSVMGTAVCYGAAKLDLNPEAQIAVQCAVATGGEPEAFAGCAGGLLTKRELEKCQQNGVGGADGCFGPNNDIIKQLSSGGLQIAAIYGPANPIVKKWNEAIAKLQQGARDEGRRMLKEAANTIAKAPGAAAQQATDFVAKAMPRITVGKPSVSIGGRRFSL